MVLDTVIGPSLEHFCDNSPLIRLIAILKVENPFFLSSPRGASLDVWIQMVMPSLPALLANSPRKVTRYFGPVWCSINVDQMQKKSILDVGPWTFYESRV